MRGKAINIYLSGPMRGMPDSNFPAFAQAAIMLREAGDTVFSPADGDTWLKHTGREITARICFELDTEWICRYADAIALMKGWEHSKGARAEKALGEALGLEIIYL